MSLCFPNPTTVKLIDANPRSEAHGPVKVPALDLRFSCEMSNAVLGLLHPQLRAWLYEEDPQGQLDGVDKVSEYTALRFPELASPFAWKEEVNGNILTVDYGIGQATFPDCKLHKQAFETKKGGTCKVSFTLSCTHDLSAEVVGGLGMRVQHDMLITLRADDSGAAS